MRIFSVLFALSVAAATSPVRAETVYGLSTAASPSLLVFDSATPAAVTTVAAITGVVAGESLRAIDFRPADGKLYGLSVTERGNTAHLYTIDLVTAKATVVGGALTLDGNTSDRVSIDFNPVVDRLRVVTFTGENYRINPNNGTVVARDTDLTSVDIISEPQMTGIAYTNNFVGATQTTLYGYEYLNDGLFTIGGINGVPSPNGGVLSFVGSSGIIISPFECGMDISGATGMAYFACGRRFMGNGDAEFFTVDLATGFHTQIGPNDFAPVLDISVLAMTTPIPEPETWALMMAGLLAAGAVARGRRRGEEGTARLAAAR